MTDRELLFLDFAAAGANGRLQWLGYWQPAHAGDKPSENCWMGVYRHEARAMLWSHGVDRFRIKPAAEIGKALP